MEDIEAHHNFIHTTDRKSLYTQIKEIVKKAKRDERESLSRRRKNLKMLLEYEDKIFEEEFSMKVKSRIDEDIRARRDALLKIKEEVDRQSHEFVEKKRIQQHMESCYEIRQALRQKETQNVKEVQLEQMIEKERALKAERDLDKFWAEVQNKNLKKYDENQRMEDCLKAKNRKYIKETLDWQMELKELRVQEDRDILAAEVKRIDNLLDELRLEEFNKRISPKPAKDIEIAQELLEAIAENKQRKKTEACELANEHKKMCEELQRLQEEEKIMFQTKKRAFNEATKDYIAYVKHMRKWEDNMQKMRDDRIDDLFRIDMCTKGNIRVVKMRKAEEAARCFAELKKQVCEQYERNLREHAERKECKILENRFARQEITREEVLEQHRKNREGLDKQIEVLKRIRAEEQEKYKNDLVRASNDPEYCTELAEKYLSERIDYLEPHPNWRIVACNVKEYVGKKTDEEAFAAKFADPEKSTCIRPCGVENRAHLECALKNDPIN